MEKTSPAPYSLRIYAHLFDFILFNAITYGLDLVVEWFYYQFLKLSGLTNLEMNQALSFVEITVTDLLVTVVFAWFYYVLPQVKTGQTLGKKLFKIEVVVASTLQRMNLKQSVIRALGYLASYLIFACGFLMFFFNPKRQALHDLFVGTITIRSKV